MTMTTRAVRSVLVGAAASLLVVACGQGDRVELVGGIGTDDVRGRTFLSTKVTDNGAPRPLVPGSRVTLTFPDRGGVSASAGCNMMGADMRIDGGRLLVDGPVNSTEMSCEAPLDAQDRWLAQLLEDRPSLALAGDRLTVTRGTTVIELLDERVATPALSLTGTAWTLDTVEHDGVASSVPAGVTSTLRIAADGTVALRPGCNTGTTTATVEGDRLTFGSVALTKRFCAGDPSVIEDAVLRVIDNSVQYEIKGNTLRLVKGTSALVYLAPSA